MIFLNILALMLHLKYMLIKDLKVEILILR